MKDGKMGDRYQRTKPYSQEEMSKNKKERKRKVDFASDVNSFENSRLKGKSLLTDTEEMSGVYYRPKTAETKQTYEVILTIIQEALGDQPRDVLCGAADEVLGSLKNQKTREKERRREVESLVGKMPDDKYSVLVNLTKKITDFAADDSKPLSGDNPDLDDTLGVNVQFEESEEEEDDEFLDEVKEEEDEERDEEDKEEQETALEADEELDSGSRSKKRETDYDLVPRDIDAYWLQRKLSKTYDDPVVSRNKANEVLEILKSASDERELENHLVVLLGFTQFDMIKLLRKHRQMILYCTLLASAQTSGEKNKIKQEMTADPVLLKILRHLEGTDSGDQDDHSSRKSKKSKSKGSEMEVDQDNKTGEVLSSCKILDLDDMSFTQGSHFMANRKCQLPEGSFRNKFKGYEEIHIMPLKSKPFEANEVSYKCKLSSISPAYPEGSRLVMGPSLVMERYYFILISRTTV